MILSAVTPALATLASSKFMWTWNEFFWPLVVVNSPAMKTVTMGLIGFTNMYFIDYNLVTAAAVLRVLPILLLEGVSGGGLESDGGGPAGGAQDGGSLCKMAIVIGNTDSCTP